MRISVRAKPRATKSRVLGVREGALEVAIAAPPVDGAANEELRRTLAKAFDVSKSAVVLLTGLGGKNKVVEIAGISLQRVSQVLAALSS